MRQTILLFFLFFIFSAISCQTDSLLARAKKIYGHESIFLHTDKNNYTAGETIWLKAYLYDGIYPSTQSSAIKIQLIANDSSVLSEKIYPSISGVANGNIKLPLTINAGRYFIRAISNAGLENKLHQDFVAPLIIYNPSSFQKTENAVYKAIPEMQVTSPDKLVAGLSNQIYVSVFDQYKQPIAGSGYLLNDNNDTITAFSTNQFGIAELKTPPVSAGCSFVLANNAQKVILKKESFLHSGITMNISRKDGSYNINLEATPDMYPKEYYLTGEYQYQVLFKTKVNFREGKMLIRIPVSQLPTGICRVVLLSASDDALCERFLFSNNTDGIVQTGNALSLKYSDTLQSNFKFSMADTVEGTYSLNITDPRYDFGSFYKNENIISRFFLTANFKNYCPVYFGLIDDLQTCDVDVINQLLATQELIIPKWEEIKNLTAGDPDEDGGSDGGYLKLSGTVKPDGYKSLPKNPFLSIVVSLADSSFNYFKVPLNGEGKFELDNLLFTDTARIYYKLDSKIYKPVKLEFTFTNPDNDFISKNDDRNFFKYYPPVTLTNTWAANNTYAQKQQQLFNNLSSQTHIDKELAPLTVITQKTMREKYDEVDKRYTTNVFSGYATSVFDFINQPQIDRPLNVIDYLKIYSFAGRMVVGNSSIVKPVGWGSGVPYTIFIDEGMASFEALQSIDIRNVALIKVFSGSFLLANESGPAIAVYTKKPEDGALQFDTHMQHIKIPGYSSAQDFINPDQDYVQFVNKKDLQSTFYWNPYLTLNKEEKNISVLFYNINKAQKAKLVLQGMRSDGRLIYLSREIQSEQVLQ